MNIYEHILKAIEEARKRMIEANTIVIDKELAMVNSFCWLEGRDILECPPMIFGMKVIYDENLPNNANFFITKAPKNKMEKINDLEEELGIDLITLFKAIKEGIYSRDYGYLLVEHFVLKHEKQLHCKPTNRKELRFALKDYGKTWSLRKEDLEDEN